MTLSLGVFLLVMMAALFHAAWNALVKSGGDKLVMQTFVVGVPSVACASVLPFLPLPAVASWPYLAVSVGVHCIYYATLIYAYEHGDLSQVYPIARGTAPALVAVIAWVAAGETLTPLQTVGLLTVSAGILSLSRLTPLIRRHTVPRDGEIKAIVFALLTAMTIGVYSAADGLGVRQAGSAAAYICWLLFLEAVPLIAFTLWRRRRHLRGVLSAQWKTGLGAGLIGGTAYGTVIWAMSVAPLAHVVALRETSVIIAAFIGTRMLGEPFGRPRILAAIVVAGGAALLNLDG